MSEIWIAVHRGTKRDIDTGTDYYRIGPVSDVDDPDAICVNVAGPDSARRAAFIVEAVNSHTSLTDELTRLREENERLRDGLCKIVDGYGPNHLSTYARYVATSALFPNSQENEP